MSCRPSLPKRKNTTIKMSRCALAESAAKAARTPELTVVMTPDSRRLRRVMFMTYRTPNSGEVAISATKRRSAFSIFSAPPDA